MSKCWKIAPGYNQVVLPGVGCVTSGRILEGEQFRRFAEMGLLVEASQQPLEDKPVRRQLLTEIQPLPEVEKVESDTEDTRKLLTDSGKDSKVSVKKKGRPRKKG